MKLEYARRLLDRIDVLRYPCDLELLIFFARHPRALITSEQLTTLLGCELQQIAALLDVVLEAAFLTRTQNPRHAARMYVFAAGVTNGGWPPLSCGKPLHGKDSWP